MTPTINLLDPSQRQVLNSLLENRDQINVVYGPPGTGKSHLIVSLLFELAVRGQKVLFVSQNVEALQVIGRMIAKLENEFRLGSNHLSFLDFCWQLTDSQQRRLHYLRDTRSRLANKQIRSFHNQSQDSEPLSPYRLAYTHLDKSRNERIGDNAPMAIDELLSYYLHFVGERTLTPDTVKKIQELPVRQILQLLTEFSHQNHSDDFVRFNHPHDVIKWLEPTNLNLDLVTIHAQAQTIETALIQLPNESLTHVSTTQKITINNFLKPLSQLLPLTQLIRIDCWPNDETTSKNLQATIIAARDACQQKQTIAPLTITNSLTDNLFVNTFWSLANTDDSKPWQDLLARLQTIPPLMNELVNLGIDLELIWSQVFTAAFGGLDSMVTLLTEFTGLYRLHAADLQELITSLDAWKKRPAWHKVFTSIPEKIKKTKPRLRKRDLDTLIQQQTLLAQMLTLISETDLTLGDLADLLTLPHSKKTALDPLANFTSREREKVRHLLCQLYDASQPAKIAAIPSTWTLSQWQQQAELMIHDLQSLQTIINDNKKIASQESISEFITHINTQLDNQRFETQITQARQQLSSLWREQTDVTDFVTSLAKLAQLIEKINITTLIAPTSWQPLTNVFEVKTKSWTQLQTAINESLAAGIFSDEFYCLSPGQTLQDFLERIRSLRAYQNLAQFDAYKKHQRFLHTLCELLTPDNAANVQEFLRDDITLGDLNAKITNDLVTAYFQSLPADERPIIDHDFFVNYAQQQRQRRRDYFVSGLDQLLTHYLPETIKLKAPHNWQQGRGVMEKIRHNSQLILQAYPVVIATPKEVSKYLDAREDMFDVVIFDEASQTLPGQALPSLYRSKQAIIVGDPHQMPPTLATSFAFGGARDENLDDDLLENETSILDLAIKAQIDHSYHLKVHYRSESNLLFEPSRKAIYDTYDIKPIFEARSLAQPLTIKDSLGENDVDNFAVIAQIIKQKLDTNPESSFCLLFTRKQDVGEREFRQYLSTNTNDNKILYQLLESGRLLISTVTNCQGIEADHAIIYFNYYQNPAATWFFKEQAGAYKRLNVAVTRQRRSLTILMANSRGQWLEASEKYNFPGATPNAAKSGELMMSLLNNTGKIIDRHYLDEQLSPNLEELESPLARHLYDLLQAHFATRISNGQLCLWTNIGWPMTINADGKKIKLVGFKIDLGIFDPNKNQFILGIECDGSVYHDDFSGEFSHEGRPKTLSIKGWEIYRVWSSNWLADFAGEWRRLIKVIEEKIGTND
ncbi:hypothetical protein IJJ08_04960 [bacterium]|nr:hypothetical protein [bacterium]